MVRVSGWSGGAIYTRIIPPSWTEWVGFGPVWQKQSYGLVFTKISITHTTKLQWTCHLFQVDFTIFPSIYFTWVGPPKHGSQNLEQQHVVFKLLFFERWVTYPYIAYSSNLSTSNAPLLDSKLFLADACS
jgi:hypothetical protein